MCGICGAAGIESREEGALVLARMLPAIMHRGPDEEGTLVAPGLVAGTRRLSIIDIPGGSQPVWNEDRTLAVCYNGEIYNFRELRDELLAAGHKFRTHSDTEVIVHAYESWGTQAFERFHGMFAFVIAEMPRGEAGPVANIVLARDRFGIKPLYYSFSDGAMLFASEVRALLASGHLRQELCTRAVSAYLLFGSVVEPQTLLNGVYSLPPGHFLRSSPSSPACAPEPRPYWSVSGNHARTKTASPDDAAPRVRQCLERAVRSHLIADVSVGVFLSSGLDSTAIAAMAASAQSGIHTFTVGFPDLDFSEGAQARRSAEFLGTQHSELQLSGDEMLARLDEAIGAFDQPSMDGINTYFVSWAARQTSLKVALSGLGSDELFGGYPTFRSTHSVSTLARAARLLPQSLRRAGASISAALVSQSDRPAFDKAMAAWLEPDSLPHPYFFTRTLFPPQTLRLLSQNSADWETAAWWRQLASLSAEAARMDAFTSISWLELRSYMLNTLLRDTDAMSMHHSLEVRVPFLDVNLVDCVLSLPESQKTGVPPKSLLIAAVKDILPPGILGQRKSTFTLPWEKWLRGSLSGQVEAGLRDWSSALTPVIGGAFALAVWDNFKRGRTTWSRPWSLYVLNEWAKRHLRGERALAADSNAGVAAAFTA